MQVLLTNAYIVYKNTLEMAEAEPILHYEFQKEIAMAWIDPDRFGCSFHTPSENEGSTISTLSRASTKSSGSGATRTRKRIYITEKGMNPKKGKLCGRLNHTLGH